MESNLDVVAMLTSSSNEPHSQPHSHAYVTQGPPSKTEEDDSRIMIANVPGDVNYPCDIKGSISWLQAQVCHSMYVVVAKNLFW